MDYKAPFLVLPDYRENLVMELLPGIPASGNIPDTSGNGNDAVRTGCTRDKTLANIPVLTFAAGNKLTISLVSDLNIISGVQTIVAWIRVSNLAAFGSIWSSYNDGNACNVVMGVRDTSKMYYVLTADEEAENFEAGGGAHIPNEEWVMVVYQLNVAGSSFKFYVYDLSEERILTKTQAVGGNPYTFNQSIIIGYENTENFPFIGSMAMIRQYNVVLTALQLKNIYQYTRRHIIGASPKI